MVAAFRENRERALQMELGGKHCSEESLERSPALREGNEEAVGLERPGALRTLQGDRPKTGLNIVMGFFSCSADNTHIP